jgi:putative endonuclease
MKKKDTSSIARPDVSWWLYLLACKDGRTYAGITVDLQTRFELHIAGKASKFTRANPPLSILGAQAFPNRSEASKAEYALKQLDKRDKLAWARKNPIKHPQSTTSAP